MSKFIPGLELSDLFYKEIIQPMLLDRFPGLEYSTARLDYGSDVLGFDTPMSMDHGWGPKLTLYLSETDFNHFHLILNEYFAYHLPFEFYGFPTHFAEPMSDGGVMTKKENYPIHHGITITTIEKFFFDYLGVNIHHSLTPAVWLTIPQQRLRTLRAGQIFYDDLGISILQDQFHWYPHDLWLYLLASQWQRINQAEPFVGRTGSVGDEIGARLIASMLVQNLMRLSFLMEKKYTPYLKWFGSAFQQLNIAPELTPMFDAIINSIHWQQIETNLSKAYQRAAEAHNALKITPFIPADVSPFYNRPFLVPHASRFVTALLAQIRDPSVRALPPHLGNIDQIVDNTDLLESIPHCQLLANLYQDPSSSK